jgi:hypothetical protein
MGADEGSSGPLLACHKRSLEQFAHLGMCDIRCEILMVEGEFLSRLTRIVLLGLFALGAHTPAIAQQRYACPNYSPQIKQKVIADLIAQIKRQPYPGCNGNDTVCVIAMQFYLMAMGYGEYKTPSGTPWSVLYGCIPELSAVKALNDLALAQAQEVKQQQAKVAQQTREEQQTKENNPKHLLIRSYYDYIVVRKCFEQRKGYVAVNIYDEEMDRAKEAAKAIEDAILKSNPNIDKAAAWKGASSDSSDWMTDRDQTELIMSRYNSQLELDHNDRNRCQQVLGMLEERLSRIVPEATAVKKDF